MGHGDFVWSDLSARQLEAVSAYYTRLFGWSYEDDKAPDGSIYRNARTAAAPTAGLFTMPQKFQDLGMPCFWMSYVEADSAAAAVELARSKGGKVEVGPIDGSLGTKVALIRDPLGAGFTVIEGEGLRRRTDHPKYGDMAWNDLYVSDAGTIIPFYEALFGWTITPNDSSSECFDVKLGRRTISTIWELDESLRGKKQYWAVHFTVDDLDKARRDIRDGGDILYDDGTSVLARDPDGAAFFVLGVN